jgi:fatty-acyl-CoA synthase
VLPRWDRRAAARAIARHRVTHWANIPTMVIDLLSGDDLDRYDLGSLRYIGGGGAPMPDAVGRRLKELFGLSYVEGYGLTETAAPTHVNPMNAPRLRCLGIPFIGTHARVIDPETRAVLPPGEAGEIVVRGPQLFMGYWRQPEATAAAFVEIDGERYFRTGDLGLRDADGYYHLTDRLKRMINASGFKVWPAEVEALLHRHPAIRETCVIASRDPYRGESVKALVVLHESHRAQVAPEDIVAWSREHMAAYKVPREVVLVDELPRSATGKVLWRRAQARQDESDAARAAAAAVPARQR